MSNLLKKMMSVYMDAATGDESGAGGGGANDQADLDIKAAADKVTADAVAAKALLDAADKNKVSDKEATLLKEVMEKKNALKKTNDELATLKATIAGLEELGGVEALKALAMQKKTLEEKKLEEQGEWSRLKAQMNDEHNKVLQTQLDLIKVANLDKEALQNEISNLTVGGAFAASEFIKDSLVMPLNKVKTLYGGHFEYKDGKVAGYDKPVGSSERTMFVDAKGDPLGFDAAMAKIIDADSDRDSMLKSKSKAGSGSGGMKKTTEPNLVGKLHGLERIGNALRTASK